MPGSTRRDFLKQALPVIGGAALAGWREPNLTDVRAFGAVGDGVALDTAAVNRAIAAAARAGGGVVRFSRGTYACHSIRLKSNITLRLDRGATILAAPAGGYDGAEPNPWGRYQDFGHGHFHNSLIWGEGLHDVAILGPGLVWGKGLSRGGPDSLTPGAGDKAIALKNCANVTLRDFSVLAGGHFAVLATGVDDLLVENLTIDTNRDGIDIDCCRRVRVSNCRVNSPHDDSICLKSSFALGHARATEDVRISDCYVTGGYRIGALIDGSHEPLAGGAGQVRARQCMMGRIKLGTESNGGFRNVTIENCVCERSLGLAFESVDGGALENVLVRGMTMRDIRGAPLFLRLGARLRGPAGIGVGALRGVTISGLTCRGPASRAPSIISGIPGHPIADIALRDLDLLEEGGGSKRLAGLVPPEEDHAYPETDMFGPLPAQALFARHVRNLELSRVAFRSLTPDARPAIWLEDVQGARFSALRLPSAAAVWRYERHKAFLSGAL
ncbi:MAG TPA: glycosyl hydrolase family 28-related protein [Stellaceae bacterium]|nr:glycosyl hydrolase family 28-related protein [Stellaceae bacterium]